MGGGGTRAQWDPVAQVHGRGQRLSCLPCAHWAAVPAAGSPLCFGAVAECTAGTGLLGPPSSAEARMLAPRGGASPGQSLGSWAVAPLPGGLEHSATTGPQMRGGGARTTWGIVFAHSLLSPPLPGWRMPQAWADVACSPKHTHICPFGPRHQQEERGSWRKGRRPLPREGALPTLGVRAYMTVHCRASCRPAHFVILAWALTCGCRWPSAAPGLAHSLELTRGLCVRLAGLRLTRGLPILVWGWPRTMAGNSKHCTLKPKAP